MEHGGPVVVDKPHGSYAYLLLGKTKNVPARATLQPAYAPGFFWLSVVVGIPFALKHQNTRKEKTYCYPTVVAASDVEDALTVWGLAGLKWEGSWAGRVWRPPSPLAHTAFEPSVTYFATTSDLQYLTVGSANVSPIGASKCAWTAEGEKLTLQRLGVCRLSQPKAEAIVDRYGARVTNAEVRIKNDNGLLWTVTPRLLKRVARSCARHYRKYIIDGKRNLLAPYQDGVNW